MIFLPVNPVSPWGPPMTKTPVGLIWYVISLVNNFWRWAGNFATTRGINIATMSFLMVSNITASEESKSSCWVEITIASILWGTLSSEYSIVTWDFASGLK